MTATACGAHMLDPSTNVDACRHTCGTLRRHGAQYPNGSPGGRPTACVTTGTVTRRDHDGMPWSRTRPRSRKYGREHRDERERHMAALIRQGAGLCAERICVKRTRVITPDMDLHLCHAPDGVTVLGLGHAACNVREAARRARAKQTRRHHTTERSHLRW